MQRASEKKRALLRQKWRDLLFIHWEAPAELVQKSLPRGLFVDTFEGRAYWGVVPFTMRSLRPAGLPAVPMISDFYELNLRTYVMDDRGRPGVWFYSLDADSWISVKIARAFFHLPYELAEFSFERREGGDVFYRSLAARDDEKIEMGYGVCVRGRAKRAALGSLEAFLVERYRLYAYDAKKRRLLTGTLRHEPYEICDAEALEYSKRLFPLNGFGEPGGGPVSVLYSKGVDVEVFGIEKVE
ncbi:MAG: DUF2071 domain-containing protein [Verrucomicrobiota bacterium]